MSAAFFLLSAMFCSKKETKSWRFWERWHLLILDTMFVICTKYAQIGSPISVFSIACSFTLPNYTVQQECSAIWTCFFSNEFLFLYFSRHSISFGPSCCSKKYCWFGKFLFFMITLYGNFSINYPTRHLGICILSPILSNLLDQTMLFDWWDRWPWD